MVTEEYRGTRQWSRKQQAVATVIWISFLCAAVMTMVFFAVFDPRDLWSSIGGAPDISVEAGYAVGFFAFWLFSASTSALTAWLVRTALKRNEVHHS